MEQFVRGSSFLKKKVPSKSQKFLRLKTVGREINLVESSSPMRKMSETKARINSLKSIFPQVPNQKLRKYTQVEEQLSPQQKPLKLSPTKLLQTKLKISGESWVIYDMKTNTYKRGWKPNKVSTFDGILRILVLLCYCQVIKQNEKLKNIKVKINHEHLKESKLKVSKKDKKAPKCLIPNKETFKTFENGSIIYFVDLVKSMIVTGNQDLFEYCVIYCGYLIYHMEHQPVSMSIDQTITFDRHGQEFYAEKLCDYCNSALIKSSGLVNTRVSNQKEKYELISTPNQICQIFVKGFTNEKFFRDTLSQRKITFYYKFQLGYNYWEDRVCAIKNPKDGKIIQYACFLVYKGQKNYEAICYNSNLGILMVVEDSKFSMADLDIAVLQNWYVNVTKPIGFLSPSKKNKSIFPILEISNKR